MQFITEQYFFKKKTKDRLIHDYKFISIPYFQFLVWTKNMKKKIKQDIFRPNGHIYIYIYIYVFIGKLLRWGFLIWELIFLFIAYCLSSSL